MEEDRVDEERLSDLLDCYMDLAVKQDEVIFLMGNIIRKQNEKIKQMQLTYGFFDYPMPGLENDKRDVEEAMRMYEAAKL